MLYVFALALGNWSLKLTSSNRGILVKVWTYIHIQYITYHKLLNFYRKMTFLAYFKCVLFYLQAVNSKWSYTHILQTRVLMCSLRMYSWSLSCCQCCNISSVVVLVSATMMVCGCRGYLFSVLVCCRDGSTGCHTGGFYFRQGKKYSRGSRGHSPPNAEGYIHN